MLFWRITSGIYVNIIYFILAIPPNYIDVKKGDREFNGVNTKSPFTEKILKRILMSIFSMIYIGNYGDEPLNTTDMLYLSHITMFFILRMWCHLTLGTFFTHDLGIKNEHKLVKTGPYKYLIHPSHTAKIGIMIGMTLLLKLHIFVIIPIILYMLHTSNRTISLEEKMMEEHFGDEYVKYRKKRGRFLPFF
jgi:protein-S-isoprenylcysteine O-methyltransferase Ste14